MGVIVELGETFVTPGNVAPGASPLILGPYEYDVPFTAEDSVLTYVHMHQTNEAFLFGARQTTFVEDFYFRIYLIPEVVNFGLIVNDKLSIGAVWNAYLDSVTLNSATPDVGVEVTMGNPARPVGFGGLQIINFPFTATKAGPTILQEFFTLDFDNGDSLIWPMVGVRPEPPTDLTWNFYPTWDESYTVTYEYQTDIIESERGNEQRRRNRQNPRRKTEFTAQFHDNTERRAFNKLMTRQTNRFYVPEYPRYVMTTTQIGSVGLSVNVDDTPWWIAVGFNVMLNDGKRVSVRTIESVMGNTVTFTTGEVAEWPANVKLHPAILGWWGEEFTTQALTNWVSTLDVSHRGAPGYEAPLPRDTAPAATFDGRELWTKGPNWDGGFEITKIWPREFMDYTVGRIESLLSRQYGKTRMALSYVAANMTQHDELFFFFVRMQGRAGEFYMPSWDADLELAEDLIETEDRVLVVGGQDFLDAYENDTTRAAILIETTDGGQHFFPLASVGRIEDSNSETEPFAYLYARDTWGESILLADIERVMWVSLYRFSSDQLTVTHYTDSVSTMTFTVEEIERATPDSSDDSNSGSAT